MSGGAVSVRGAEAAAGTNQGVFEAAITAEARAFRSLTGAPRRDRAAATQLGGSRRATPAARTRACRRRRRSRRRCRLHLKEQSKFARKLKLNYNTRRALTEQIDERVRQFLCLRLAEHGVRTRDLGAEVPQDLTTHARKLPVGARKVPQHVDQPAHNSYCC